MITEQHLYLIIPAAGQSRRMGTQTSKLLLPVAGIPVLARTLILFQEYRNTNPALIIHGVIAASPDLIPVIETLCRDHRITIIEDKTHGGATRQQSVHNAIRAAFGLPRPPQADDIVFVHDGARCLTETTTLNSCLHDAKKYGACTAAVSVKDTIKTIESTGSTKVSATPNRETLYAVQTPQAFTWDILRQSYEHAEEHAITGTDDTSLAEAMGHPVYLSQGSYTNIKITTPEDLILAEAILAQQSEKT